MNSKIRALLSLLLAIGIASFSLLLVLSMFLQSTLFSKSFYKKMVTGDDYIPMLKQAITNDLKAQSSYVAMPLEVLTAGLDDKVIDELLEKHVEYVINYMEFKGEFIKVIYPSKLFRDRLEIFIKADGEKNGYIPSKEQSLQLDAVALDSAEIVSKHLNLININVVEKIVEFQKIHSLLFKIGNLIGLFLILIISLIAVEIFLNRRKIEKAILYIFSAFWVLGALLLVPSAVLLVFGITKRLAIRTMYLKYSIDTGLGNMNSFILYSGITLFTISSIILISRVYIMAREKFTSE